MKRTVIACLCWYDERTDWLADCIASCAPFAHHVVAADGPWHGGGSSPSEQVEAIRATATAHRMGVTIHQRPAYRGEPHKRAEVFALAERLARRGDWLFLIDADEIACPDDSPQRLLGELEWFRHDVGAVRFSQPPMATMRRFFRAGVGLDVTAQDTYRINGGTSVPDPDEWPERAELPLLIDHSRGLER